MNILLSLVAAGLVPACGTPAGHAANEEPAEYVLDGLLSEGNHYDVASYLVRHPDFLSETAQSFNDGEWLNYETSADGRFRVYSMQYLRQANPPIENIIQFAHPYGPALRLEEMRDMGRIESVGMVTLPSKNYYLAVTGETYCSQGSYYTSTVRAFSLNNYTCEFKRAQVFKTKSGKMLDTIEVHWNDRGGSLSASEENFVGVSLEEAADSEMTAVVCVQVISSESGLPTDNEICYSWNGRCFEYEGIRDSMTSEMIRR